MKLSPEKRWSTHYAVMPKREEKSLKSILSPPWNDGAAGFLPQPAGSRAGLLPQLILPVCLCAVCPLHSSCTSYLRAHLGITTSDDFQLSEGKWARRTDWLAGTALQAAHMGQATRVACWRQLRLKGWCSPCAAFLLFWEQEEKGFSHASFYWITSTLGHVGSSMTTSAPFLLTPAVPVDHHICPQLAAKSHSIFPPEPNSCLKSSHTEKKHLWKWPQHAQTGQAVLTF